MLKTVNNCQDLCSKQVYSFIYKKDVSAVRTMGPYVTHSLDNSHFSPFMTREKDDSDKRRVIIDLSWPKDVSVNLGIDKSSYLATGFTLTFPTVDNITDALKACGKGALLYKIDVSRAFRHVKVDPFDYDLLGLKWRDVMFFDTHLPFGSRHRMHIFLRLSDTICFMMCQANYDIINYVDDFVRIRTLSVVQYVYSHLLVLLDSLGLDISHRKLVAPATRATCLGVEIDTVSRTTAIPPEKLTRSVAMVQDWKWKAFCSKTQLQSLLGHLLYIHKCVKPSRFFLNRMLELLRANYDKTSKTRLALV